jgi:hypothetical protein
LNEINIPFEKNTENTIVEIIHAVLNNKHGDIIWIKIRRYL